MVYHPEDFIDLCSAVLDDGGHLLEDVCVGKTVRLRFPDGPEDRPVWKRYQTTNCGMVSRFDINYDAEYTAIGPDGPLKNYVRVCAVDDAVGLWPRFKDVVSSRSYLPPKRTADAR